MSRWITDPASPTPPIGRSLIGLEVDDEPDDGGPFRPRWPLLVSEEIKRELLQELAEIVHTPRPDGSAGAFARGYETGVATVMLHLGINEAASPERKSLPKPEGMDEDGVACE